MIHHHGVRPYKLQPLTTIAESDLGDRRATGAKRSSLKKLLPCGVLPPKGFTLSENPRVAVAEVRRGQLSGALHCCLIADRYSHCAEVLLPGHCDQEEGRSFVLHWVLLTGGRRTLLVGEERCTPVSRERSERKANGWQTRFACD